MVDELNRGDPFGPGPREPSPTVSALRASVPIAMTADDFRYLGKLLDWAAGQGFCQIEGMMDPDEFAYGLWERWGLNGEDYSGDALADVIAAQAIEARSGSAEGKSPVPAGDAPNPHSDTGDQANG